MAHRFCSHCGTEVEDVGGYCLLGHPLRLHAPTDSLRALRAEVDAAFEHARAQVADALDPSRVGPVAATPGPSASAPPPPPPPPVSGPVGGPTRGVWASLEHHEAAASDDPIAAFAPAPRMDWGPDRSGLKLLKRR